MTIRPRIAKDSINAMKENGRITIRDEMTLRRRVSPRQAAQFVQQQAAAQEGTG